MGRVQVLSGVRGRPRAISAAAAVRMWGSATLVIDASMKSRNATAQSSARICRPRQLCSAGGRGTAVALSSYVDSTNIGIANIASVGLPHNC